MADRTVPSAAAHTSTVQRTAARLREVQAPSFMRGLIRFDLPGRATASRQPTSPLKCPDWVGSSLSTLLGPVVAGGQATLQHWWLLSNASLTFAVSTAD
jgi:hypothetical protein